MPDFDFTIMLVRGRILLEEQVMKIGNITIHPAGMILLILVGGLCYEQKSIIPFLWLVLFMGILTPLCIWIHYHNKLEDEKMLKDFPFDSDIQKKYKR